MDEFSMGKTPSITITDNRGLNIRLIEYYRHPETPEITDERLTFQSVDIRGFLIGISDPRLQEKTSFNFRFKADLSGLVLVSEGVDNGHTVTINDIESRLLVSIDANGVTRTYDYEDSTSLGRPLCLKEKLAGGKTRVTECFEYADNSIIYQNINLCGQCIFHYDTVGLLQLDQVSLLGKAISQTRRLIQHAEDAEYDVDWQTDEREEQLAVSQFVSYCITDATGANLVTEDTKGNQHRQSYDIAGQLKTYSLKIKNALERWVAKEIQYSPSGLKTSEELGNGIVANYEYEAQTQYLVRVKTQRPTDHLLGFKLIQDLIYQYDPVGNVVCVRDQAGQTRFWHNQKVEARQEFQYDSLYQLVSASGREMANQVYQSSAPSRCFSFDNATYTRYFRTYCYDHSGNLTKISHRSPATNQRYSTQIITSNQSNRAVLNELASSAEKVDELFTAAGQQKTLLQGQHLNWTTHQELRSVKSADAIEHYCYDHQYQRTVKVTERSGQKMKVIYLPNLELRNRNDDEILQVITVNSLIGVQFQVLHWECGKPKGVANNAMHYSLSSLTGNQGIELDNEGNILSQEEYYPYGGTATWLADNTSLAGYKTRHYGNKELDMTGLYYYGRRYYQPWIGRWLSADPLGAADGNNLYRMARNNPMTYYDEQGQYPKIAHYIWLGHKELPADGISNIASFKHNNPQYQINLWSDNPTKLKNNLIERGYSQAIFNVINVQKPAPFDYQYQAAINRESTNTTYANYAAASDMLRIGILRRFGGLYMDIDVMVDGPIGEIRPLLDNQDELPDLLIHHGRDYKGKTALGNAVIAAKKNAFSLHSVMRYIRYLYTHNGVEPFLDVVPQSKFDTLTAKKNYYYPNIPWSVLMWQGKRLIPHMRRNITVDGTGPGMFVSWIRSSCPFDKSMRARKLINQSGFFGHRASLTSWGFGLNADGQTWYKPRKARRASI